MPGQRDELIDTLQRMEQLLDRFEIDTASRLHVVDYQATIELLCDKFQEQMIALTQASCDETVGAGSGGSSAVSRSVSHSSRSRARHGQRCVT